MWQICIWWKQTRKWEAKLNADQQNSFRVADLIDSDICNLHGVMSGNLDPFPVHAGDNTGPNKTK